MTQFISKPPSFKIIRKFEIEIDKRKIYRRIGYKKKSCELNFPLRKLIQEEKGKLGFLLRPASIYAILDYEETNKHPIFQNAEKIALCVCSIGPQLEEESAELLKKNEILRGVILDAFGSEAAEEVARQTDELLADKAREMGLWPSKRFSPGYKKWDLKEQQFIFQKLPARKIGVRLTECFMMVPRKSISFRINFYKEKKSSTRKIV